MESENISLVELYNNLPENEKIIVWVTLTVIAIVVLLVLFRRK